MNDDSYRPHKSLIQVVQIVMNEEILYQYDQIYVYENKMNQQVYSMECLNNEYCKKIKVF
jgi:hypothetical protein